MEKNHHDLHYTHASVRSPMNGNRHCSQPATVPTYPTTSCNATNFQPSIPEIPVGGAQSQFQASMSLGGNDPLLRASYLQPQNAVLPSEAMRRYPGPEGLWAPGEEHAGPRLGNPHLAPPDPTMLVLMQQLSESHRLINEAQRTCAALIEINDRLARTNGSLEYVQAEMRDALNALRYQNQSLDERLNFVEDEVETLRGMIEPSGQPLSPVSIPSTGD